jgi:hypothetical protein
MTEDEINEHKLNCLARWVMKQDAEAQIEWAKKQKQPMRDDIRDRIIKIRKAEYESDRDRS